MNRRNAGAVAGALAGAALVATTLLASASGSPSVGPGGNGELWVTSQDASRVHVVHGLGSVDTIQLPFGTSPHFARVAPSGRYVYVAGLGYGDVTVIRAHDRTVVQRIQLAPATPPAVNSNPRLPGGLGVHDAKPSPDGSLVLVAHWANNSLYKLAADEAGESWSVVQQMPLPKRPICVVFHPSGERAYVGTLPNGIAVVDVATLGVETMLPTTGAWSCSWAQTRDETTMYLTTNASPGFLYRLDLTTDTIESITVPLGSAHIHGMGASPNGKTLYLTSREDDSLRIVSLESLTVESVSLDATPLIPDRPDSVVVNGDNVWITLRSSGKLARFKGNQHTVDYVTLADPCPAIENLCYALHAVDGSY